MKDIRVVGIAVFGALAFAACAVKADTVVWYTFDDLGDVGTTLGDGSTVKNKANPGTHDATVYGIKNGYIKDETSIHHPYVTNGVPEFTRMWDPVSGSSASSVDRALRFPATNAGGSVRSPSPQRRCSAILTPTGASTRTDGTALLSCRTTRGLRGK